LRFEEPDQRCGKSANLVFIATVVVAGKHVRGNAAGNNAASISDQRSDSAN
jgi:hypothetical protein